MLGWFPGHMNKARREITEALPSIDVVIEVLDARLPYSSANPMLGELIRHKPVLKILTRADLADPSVTARWLDYFADSKNVKAYALNTANSNALRQIPLLCRQMAGAIRADRPARVMVMGIPNVGKSSLINGLAQRKIAKVGNEPAITKRQQVIYLAENIALIDTPGVLWPKIEDQFSGYRLAASGAIRSTAIDFIDVGTATAALLAQRYPQALKNRYQLSELMPYHPLAHSQPVDADGPLPIDIFEQTGFNGYEILQAIAKKRGGLRSGGKVDLHRGAEVLLHDLRQAKLGSISFESPEDIPKTPPKIDEDSALL